MSIDIDAPISEYEMTAMPLSNAVPFIPMICSVDMLDAIRDAPIIHHGKDLPARK